MAPPADDRRSGLDRRDTPRRGGRRHGDAQLVAPDQARAHLERLAALGIGHRRAAKLAGVGMPTIQRIRYGLTAQILARVEQAILSIQRPSLAHGCKVPSWETRRLLFILVREGFDRPNLATRLGLQSPRVQFHHRHVTVRNALKVRALYTRLTSE